MDQKKINKVSVTIVILLVIIGCGFILVQSFRGTRHTINTTGYTPLTSSMSQQSNSQQTIPAVDPAMKAKTNTSSSDNQLDQDMQNINTSLNKLDTEVNNYNAGINNQSSDNQQP